MSAWIFKIIWVPIALSLAVCSVGIFVFILKEAGWDVPFRWLTVIGLIAIIADRAVNS